MVKKYKIIKFGDEAKQSLAEGIKILSDAVGATLGPLGSNVAIDYRYGLPNVIHDGVSVAKEISVKDEFQNIGIKLVREAAIKANDTAGDGTTTATILSYALVSEGLRAIENGASPMRLRKELNDAVGNVINTVKKSAKPVTTNDEMKQVAILSAQDQEIGEKIVEALNKVGDEGVVNIDEGNTSEITIEYKEGLQFDRGYISPYFITDTSKETAEVIEPRILVTNHSIASRSDMFDLIQSVASETRDIVLICNDLDGDALDFFIANKLKGSLNVLAVQPSGFADVANENLKDIACLTGATFIDKAVKKLNSVTIDDLGKAGKVISGKDFTSIIDGKGDVKERVKQLKLELSKTDSEYKKKGLKERIAKLTSGVAIVKIGGTTEVEIKEKKERAIDALSATKSAKEEGILSGGSNHFVKYAKSLKPKTDGEKVVKSALLKPFAKLIENAGLDYLDSLVRVEESDNDHGLDVLDNEIKDLFKSGIIEPFKVVRSALECSASVAGSVLTTSVLVTEIEEDEKS